MASKNQFDLLVDVDNDDPSHLIAAAEKKAAASPKLDAAAPAPAKLPTKPPPPAQAVREARTYGAPRDSAGRGGPGRGRGGRGGRTGSRRDFGDADANGFEGGYGGGGFGDGGVSRGEDGEREQAERGREPRQPYRGGGRRGGYTDGQTGDDYVHPRRAYERHSGTGRGYEMKREGAGRGNWGTVTDEGIAQETVETVNTKETAAAPEDEKNPDDAPQSEVEKDKEGAEDEEEEKETEDKVFHVPKDQQKRLPLLLRLSDSRLTGATCSCYFFVSCLLF